MHASHSGPARDRPNPSARRWLGRLASLIEGGLALWLIYMIGPYSTVKLVSRQFVAPDFFLDAKVRDLPGMELCWTFHAYSRPYEVVLGVVELLACVLLAIPRTRAAGALVMLGSMVQVTALNIEYEIGALSVSAPAATASALVAAMRWRQVALLLGARPREARGEASRLWPRWARTVGWLALLGVGAYLVHDIRSLRAEDRAIEASRLPVFGRYRVVESPASCELRVGAVLSLQPWAWATVPGHHGAGETTERARLVGWCRAEGDSLHLRLYRSSVDEQFRFFAGQRRHRGEEVFAPPHAKPERLALEWSGKMLSGEDGMLTLVPDAPATVSDVGDAQADGPIVLRREDDAWPARHRSPQHRDSDG
jgi:hypothetical protein